MSHIAEMWSARAEERCAEFIAAARNALPRLIAGLRAARSGVMVTEMELRDAEKRCDDWRHRALSTKWEDTP